MIENIYIKNEVTNESLKLLLENKDQYKTLMNESFVLFLDASWGSGKTTFLKEFMKETESTYSFIYYDAWKNDGWHETMSPIASALKENENISDKIDDYVDAIANLTLKKSMDVLIKLVLDIAKNKLGVSAETLNNIMSIPSEVSAEMNKSELLEISEGFEAYKATKEKFSEYLKENLSDKNVVLIIDELDRCKPKFAIETLEFIKHFFDSCNMTFIISTDLCQLGESIKSVYGNINSDIYLSKFYDYKLVMPKINIRSYIYTYYKNYVSAYEYESEIASIFELATEFNLSIREIQKVLIKFKTFPYAVNFKFVAFMVILKLIDIVSYSKLMSKHFQPEKQYGLPEFILKKYNHISFLRQSGADFINCLEDPSTITTLHKL